MLKRALNAAAATAVVVAGAAMLTFIGANWVTGCESWDREQWTEEHSCVAPSDVWKALKGLVVSEAQADELRRQRRDYEARISPSWERRLEQMDRERAREERQDRRRRDREWRDLTRTDDEKCDCHEGDYE